jgi:hypothetical protein
LAEKAIIQDAPMRSLAAAESSKAWVQVLSGNGFC